MEWFAKPSYLSSSADSKILDLDSRTDLIGRDEAFYLTRETDRLGYSIREDFFRFESRSITFVEAVSANGRGMTFVRGMLIAIGRFATTGKPATMAEPGGLNVDRR